jgi:hypothetical protein
MVSAPAAFLRHLAVLARRQGAVQVPDRVDYTGPPLAPVGLHRPQHTKVRRQVCAAAGRETRH